MGGTCRPAPCWHQQDESSQSPYRNGGSCAVLPLLRLRAGDKVFLLLAWPVRQQDTQDTQSSLASEWSSVRQLEKVQLAKCMKHLEWRTGGGGRECCFLPDHSLLVPTSLVVGDGALRTSCEHKGSSHSVFRQRALLGQEILVVGRCSQSMYLTLAFIWDEPGRGWGSSRMGTPQGPALSSLGLFL